MWKAPFQNTSFELGICIASPFFGMALKAVAPFVHLRYHHTILAVNW